MIRYDLSGMIDTWYKVKWGGFFPSFKLPTCLAAQKSCDTTEQSVCG